MILTTIISRYFISKLRRSTLSYRLLLFAVSLFQLVVLQNILFFYRHIVFNDLYKIVDYCCYFSLLLTPLQYHTGQRPLCVLSKQPNISLLAAYKGRKNTSSYDSLHSWSEKIKLRWGIINILNTHCTHCYANTAIKTPLFSVIKQTQ